MGEIVNLRQYNTDGLTYPELEKRLNSILEQQGWFVKDQGDERFIEKTMSNCKVWGFFVSSDCRQAVIEIENKYKEYKRNGTRKSLLEQASRGGKMAQAIMDNLMILNSLRKLRNAFLPHDLTTPEWVNDILNSALTLGIETFCIKDGNTYVIICTLPNLDYAMDFKGETAEEMALCVDYKVDTFSDAGFYRFCVEQDPELDDYKTLSRAKMIKQKLKQFRDAVAGLFPAEATN